MKDIILIFQIIVAITLIILVLLQSKGGGLGSTFGTSSQVYRSKRGVEKFIVYLTVIVISLFFVVSILQVIANR